MANTLLSAGAQADVSMPSQIGVTREHAAGIGFDGVTVAYNGHVVLDALTLQVKPGEIVALIGPSGSGKTTALRAVAGFVRPVAGRIRIGERDVTDLAPYDRHIGMVVQNYALFPHMRVEENVAFGLETRRQKAAMIRTRVADCLRIVGMEAYAKRYPRELSGGQQQRVAIARALAIQPQVLLLDEPLSALDAQIRRSMLEEIAKLHRELPSLTILYVTHDQTEALTLANHIGIMRDGKLAAFGSAQSLYRDPPNRFAAAFLGRANLLPATSLVPIGTDFAQTTYEEMPLTARNPHRLRTTDKAFLCIRPHDLHLQRRAASDNMLAGIVQGVQWLGELHSIAVDVDGHTVNLSCAPLAAPPALGSVIAMHFDPADAMFVPEFDDHA